MKLIVTDDRGRPAAPDLRLIAAIAQGHGWFETIRRGEASSISALAQQTGKDRTDIGRALPLAHLAPDIVEAILAGRQPIELTAARLRRIRRPPLLWVDQRRILGFSR